MKVLVAVLVSVLVAHTLAGEVAMRRSNRVSPQYITSVTRTTQLDFKKLDLCPLCIDFADEAIEMLTDLTLDISVLDTCELLCDALASKTGSQFLGAICQFLCDIEGINEFVKILQKVDLDDIYFCELVKGCPIFDGGDAHITELSITPVSGPRGKRVIDLTYFSKNGTGSGQLDLNVITVDEFPVDGRIFNKAAAAGRYSFKFTLDASGDCESPCEQWKNGNYTLVASVCNGECGSKHPHSEIYDTRTVHFTITDRN